MPPIQNCSVHKDVVHRRFDRSCSLKAYGDRQTKPSREFALESTRHLRRCQFHVLKVYFGEHLENPLKWLHLRPRAVRRKYVERKVLRIHAYPRILGVRIRALQSQTLEPILKPRKRNPGILNVTLESGIKSQLNRPPEFVTLTLHPSPPAPHTLPFKQVWERERFLY